MRRALAAGLMGAVIVTAGVGVAPAGAGAVAAPAVLAAPGAGSAPAAAAARQSASTLAADAGHGRLIASLGDCPASAGGAAQAGQMLCLTNFARHAEGLPALTVSRGLRRAAAYKDADILGCDEFSHEACGRDFTHWIERFTDCRGAAENIAWGTGALGGTRAIFRAWMYSPGHRENILGPYAQVGIALRVGDLEGNGGAHVWTQDFGASC